MPLAVKQVLVSERYTMQETDLRTARERAIRGACCFQGAIRLDRDEAVQVRLKAFCALEACTCGLVRRHRSFADRSGELRQAEVENVLIHRRGEGVWSCARTMRNAQARR